MKYGLSYTLITRVTGFSARTFLYYRRTEFIHICDWLKGKKDLRVLDYGCNTGFLLKMINNRHPNKFDLCGADINSYALKYARNKNKDFSFYDINPEFFEKEKFDVIILSHVLEHVHNREDFVKDLKKILKKDGTLIVAVPQERIRGDVTLVQLLYNILRLRFENPHVVNINYNMLNTLLDKNSMKISDHVYTNFFLPSKSNDRRIHSWSLVAFCNNKEDNSNDEQDRTNGDSD